MISAGNEGAGAGTERVEARSEPVEAGGRATPEEYPRRPGVPDQLLIGGGHRTRAYDPAPRLRGMVPRTRPLPAPPRGSVLSRRAFPAPSRGTSRRPSMLAYFGGTTRTDPIFIFVGSTVGFAAISLSTLTPSFCEIAHIVSPFLTV